MGEPRRGSDARVGEWPVTIIALKQVLHAEAVEINAAWHCNISCRSCSHGSPSMPAQFAEAERVGADLTSLARWLSLEHVRVLGGEPLLHPHLVELLRVIRSTGISPVRRVLTNGLRLPQQPDEFWAEVEEVHVSVYPNTAQYLARHREAMKTLASASGTALVLKHFDHFRVTLRPPTLRPEFTQAIYRTCQIGNRWRCLTVEAGRIHRCPQAVLVGQRYGASERDSLEIAAIDSVETLRAWIQQEDALESCRRCTGSVGRRHPHSARLGSLLDDDGDVLDLDYLARLEQDPDADNSCVSLEEQL